MNSVKIYEILHGMLTLVCPMKLRIVKLSICMSSILVLSLQANYTHNTVSPTRRTLLLNSALLHMVYELYRSLETSKYAMGTPYQAIAP